MLTGCALSSVFVLSLMKARICVQGGLLVLQAGPAKFNSMTIRFANSLLLTYLLAALASAPVPAWAGGGPAQADAAWPRCGNDAGGMRYSPLTQINKKNVSQLAVAWECHTGDGDPSSNKTTIECTPIVVGGLLYITTARSKVLALDPASGREIWNYTPSPSHYKMAVKVSGGVNRGVACWSDGKAARRIILGTTDGLLIALDALTGHQDSAFGRDGIVELRDELEKPDQVELGMTSPPVIYKDLIICGCTVTEGPRPAAPGDIRAFDAHTGRQVWRFHTVPRPGKFGHSTWTEDGWQERSGVNAWGGLTLDEKRGIVYGGLGSASYDWYGGDRAGDNLFANCTLALDARTGKRLWHFQAVRHDIWDNDLPCPPVLGPIRRNGRAVDIAAQVTKTGVCFVFDRVTGAPIFGVEYRSVPTNGVAGEKPSPIQPFPVKPPPLALMGVTEADITDRTPEAHEDALRRFRLLRSEGPFTPGSEQGSLKAPAWHGGATWAGACMDPTTGILYVNINNAPMVVTLRPSANPAKGYDLIGAQTTPGRSERFHNAYHFNDKDGYPAIKPPWGTLNAVDLNTGDIAWTVPLGGYAELTREGVPLTGTESFGGAIVTAGGLAFIGGAMDEKFHAYDKDTGKLLWETELPAGGYATPSTYEANGRQYVIIAAGGGGKMGTKSGDAFVAFGVAAK
jgi:quinoprotein glucose dehydrogenase